MESYDDKVYIYFCSNGGDAPGVCRKGLRETRGEAFNNVKLLSCLSQSCVADRDGGCRCTTG